MQSLLTHLNNRNLDKTAADYGVQYIKEGWHSVRTDGAASTEAKPTTNREQYQACLKLCRIATEEDKVKEEDLTNYFIAHPFTEWETLQNTKKSRIDIF